MKWVLGLAGIAAVVVVPEIAIPVAAVIAAVGAMR